MSKAFFFSFVLFVFCIHLITLGMGNRKCVMASGVGKGKDGHFLLRMYCSAAVEKRTWYLRTTLTFLYFCTFVISVERQLGYVISILNSYTYFHALFKYLYFQETRMGIMSRLYKPKLLCLSRSLNIHLWCHRCWYSKERSIQGKGWNSVAWIQPVLELFNSSPVSLLR